MVEYTDVRLKDEIVNVMTEQAAALYIQQASEVDLPQ